MQLVFYDLGMDASNLKAIFEQYKSSISVEFGFDTK